MKAYEVIRNRNGKTIGYFSSYKKALCCVEKECGEITGIKLPDAWDDWKSKWYLKIDCSDVEWASYLLDKQNLNGAKFGKYLEKAYCMNDTYSIYAITVK